MSLMFLENLNHVTIFHQLHIYIDIFPQEYLFVFRNIFNLFHLLISTFLNAFAIYATLQQFEHN